MSWDVFNDSDQDIAFIEPLDVTCNNNGEEPDSVNNDSEKPALITQNK